MGKNKNKGQSQNQGAGSQPQQLQGGGPPRPQSGPPGVQVGPRPSGPAGFQQGARPTAPGQQQQRPQGPGQHQQRPPGAGYQQQRPQGPGQQQQGPGQQQQRPSGPWQQQQQRPPGPGQHQQRPPGPGYQQQRPSGPGQQQQRPSGPGQHQQRPQGPGQQQQRPPGPGQQRPQGQQQRPQGQQRSQQQIDPFSATPSEFEAPTGRRPEEEFDRAQAIAPAGKSVTEMNMFKPQKVLTNYLPLDLKKLPDIVYHYDINFTPDRPKKLLRAAFHRFIQAHFPAFVDKVAHDGEKNFYARERLLTEGDEFTGTVDVLNPDQGRNKGFSIKVKEATPVDMKSLKLFPNYVNEQHVQQAIQALDVIMRTASDQEGMVRFKRNIFPVPDRRTPLTDFDDLWIGLYQSFVLGRNPYLNVDVHHKAFPAPTTVPDVYQVASNDTNSILKTVDVSYKSPMTGEVKIFRFNGLRRSAEEERFTDDTDGRTKSVAEYYREKGQPLRNPKWPCAWVGPRQKAIYIPIECLSVPGGQALNRDNPQDAVAAIIKYAAVSTDKRKENIMRLVTKIAYNRQATIRAFGINVGEKFIQVNSHVLNAPTLQYSGSTVRVDDGVWRGEKDRFIRGGECIKWAILSVAGRYVRQDALENLRNQISRMARDKGTNFSNDVEIVAPLDPFFGDRDGPKLDKIIDGLKRNGIELLFVVVKDKLRFKDVYPAVKKSAELRCGMLTQCIQDKTLGRLNGSIVCNLLLKINAKLNGTNHSIAAPSQTIINKQPFMVIGADVTHPSPGQNTIPSVVGVAASCDQAAFRYNCQWRLQDPRDEMIRDLETIVHEQILIFQKCLKVFPKHILYYRDGVSDGQFKDVTEIELRAIQRACARIKTDYKPKLTFVVVQKRHHTRFFPVQPNPRDAKNNNVVPGTVVDSEILNPKLEQFFLVSHKSIQGVAKPSKYCILHDDANVPPDQLQTFTYNLCHMFTRCNRTVSYPAPTYYAHLVAYRGRVYIHGESINFSNLQNEYNRRQIRQEVLNKPMFFV